MDKMRATILANPANIEHWGTFACAINNADATNQELLAAIVSNCTALLNPENFAFYNKDAHEWSDADRAQVRNAYNFPVTIQEFITQNCKNDYELQSLLNVHMAAGGNPQALKEHYCDYMNFQESQSLKDDQEEADASAADEGNIHAEEADNDSDNDDENAAHNEELNHQEEGAFASNDADNQTSTQSPSSSSSAAQFANEDDNGNDDSDEDEAPVTPETASSDANKTTFWNRWWVKARPPLLILGGLAAYFGWQWLKKTKN